MGTNSLFLIKESKSSSVIKGKRDNINMFLSLKDTLLKKIDLWKFNLKMSFSV